MGGYEIDTNLPGEGMLKQYVRGQVMKAALGGEGYTEERMNKGLSDKYGRKVFSDVILKVGNDRVELINALVTVEQTKNIVMRKKRDILTSI